MPVNSFRRSTLVHIVIDPGLPVAIERQPGIVQRRYQVTADIPDITDVVVHCFKNIFNVTAVEFQKHAFHNVMWYVLSVYPYCWFCGAHCINDNVYQFENGFFLFGILLNKKITFGVITDNPRVVRTFVDIFGLIDRID